MTKTVMLCHATQLSYKSYMYKCVWDKWRTTKRAQSLSTFSHNPGFNSSRGNISTMMRGGVQWGLNLSPLYSGTKIFQHWFLSRKLSRTRLFLHSHLSDGERMTDDKGHRGIEETRDRSTISDGVPKFPTYWCKNPADCEESERLYVSIPIKKVFNLLGNRFGINKYPSLQLPAYYVYFLFVFSNTKKKILTELRDIR